MSNLEFKILEFQRQMKEMEMKYGPYLTTIKVSISLVIICEVVKNIL